MAKPKIVSTPLAKEEKSGKLPYEIDIEQLMLHSRQLHLTGQICPKVVQPIINKMMALQLISDDPIVLWINSPGGYLSDGFALVDCIRMSRVPIYTIVRGYACSMAAIVSVSAHRRIITEHSYWMAHDVAGGGWDYAEKAKFHVKHLDRLQKQVFDFWADNTSLSKAYLETAKHGELWLNAQECLENKVVDQVIRYVERKDKPNDTKKR